MAVTILCPNLKCRSVLQVPETARGKKVRCGHCGTTLLVPPPQPSHGQPPAQPATETPKQG